VVPSGFQEPHPTFSTPLSCIGEDLLLYFVFNYQHIVLTITNGALTIANCVLTITNFVSIITNGVLTLTNGVLIITSCV
jgi:hypothetical protein